MSFRIPLSKCRYPLHEININSVWPPPDAFISGEPIEVKRLDNGDYFVEDGRHRVIRALLKGDAYIWGNLVDGTEPRAACGRLHQHEPHAYGENMEEDCDGIPK